MNSDKKNMPTNMAYRDVDWSIVYEVEKICTVSETIVINFINGKSFRVALPGVLMKAMIQHGVDKAEKLFIEQDLDRDDKEHGLY